jgi:hypothetical protein
MRSHYDGPVWSRREGRTLGGSSPGSRPCLDCVTPQTKVKSPWPWPFGRDQAAFYVAARERLFAGATLQPGNVDATAAGLAGRGGTSARRRASRDGL